MSIKDHLHKIRLWMYKDWTNTGLTVALILWAVFIIFLAVVIQNKWIKTGILLYEILP